MNTPICARVRELKTLQRLYDSGKAEFLAVYGRRRVGKTFLIREFFKDKGLYFALTGVKDANTRKQLQKFSEEMERVFGDTEKEKAPKDWSQAFGQLRKAIETTQHTGRIILFLDELPWLASARSGFLQDLDHLWNRYLSADNRIILIVCGSAASWMIRKVVRNKGGLHGRLTAEIRLLPFNLRETEEFLKRQGIALTRKAIADIYMAIGGIPKYLGYIQKGQSALQIVSELCFNGPLENEFYELYASLFEHHTRHVSMIKALANHPGGLTKLELAQTTGFSAGGNMNLILEELEQSGFVMPLRYFGNLKKETHFKLIDEYSLFHLKWSAKAKANNSQPRDNHFWSNIFNTAQGRTWAGYAFEVLCLKHLPNIKEALGISGILTSTSGWVYKSPKDSEERGTQIDLLIDRADNCINLCEIKYCTDEFVIDKACDKELREKKNIFLAKTKTKKSIFVTLISPYGLKKNVEHFEAADATLTLEDLFTA